MPLARRTTSPDANTTDWQQNDNEVMTNSRINTTTTDSTSTIAARAPSDGSVASNAIKATTVNAGTFAAVNGTIVAGHSVRVRANGDLKVVSLAGAIAGGFVGVGVAVLVTNVGSATEAQVGPAADISAGASAGDVVSVNADMHEDFTGIGLAGAGGFVSVGAQVAVINDESTQHAHIDDLARITRAGGGVDVTSNAVRGVNTYAIGVGTGAFSTGAAVAVTNVSGDNVAQIGNVQVGTAATPVAHLNVAATDQITAPTLSIAVQGGVGAGVSGAVSFV
ncbi:MAG: hypothetical protein E6G64_17480, partial [Actinobacteria bacterium]